MKVRAKEFARGIVSWPNPYGLVLHTRTAENDGSTSDWSDALHEPSGSLVESPARPRRSIKIAATGPVPEDCVIPEARWTYHDERGVITKIWAADEPRPHTRRHVLGHGYTYRLVVHTPNLSWPEDCVIWNRHLLIRFTASFSGMTVRPRAVASPTGPEASALHLHALPEGIYTGRFIEVIATVSPPAGTDADEDGLTQAQGNALAALGLATRHLGANVVPEDIVLAHKIVALPGRRDETRMDLSIQVPNSVANDDLAKLDAQVTTLFGASTKRETLETALWWYLHGVRATNPRDRLTAHYIGVEAILRQYAAERGLVALASKPANDEEYPKLLRPLIERHGERAVTALIERGKNPDAPDRQCMEAYAAEHGWDEEPAKHRARTRNIRNPSLHGGRDRVTGQDADTAQALLELFLDTELG